MGDYEIIMTQDAVSDLEELGSYISCALRAPDTALAYIKRIRGKIKTLTVFPERNRLLETEPWRSMGVRKVIVQNFYIYYRIDFDFQRVYILNIIYTRRDQLNALSQRENIF